jgi:ABC-2 type transport system permease protein
MISRSRSALVQLTLTRIREYAREPESVFWTFLFPIAIALALGIAFSDRGAATVAVGVQAGEGSVELAELLDAATGIDARVLDGQAAGDALRHGRIVLLVIGRDDGVAYRYDPTRPESRLALLATDDALQRAAGRTDPRLTTEEPVTERGGRYIDFLIPGLIGLNLLSTGLWGIGYTVVRMRREKLLKRLIATPMRRGHFLLSFMLGRMVFLAAELVLLLGFAWLVFGVTVQGSLAAMLLIATIGACAFTGIGLLVISRARTFEAASGLINLTAIPMWVVSGVFFTYHHFPEALHPFIQALPLTALVDALRAVMVDGATLAATAGPLAVVAAWGIVSYGTAVMIFRWR